MWEETAEWLSLLLDKYFGEDGGSVEDGKKRQLIHHVTFGSGINPETGEEDVWHGMLDNDCIWLGEEGSEGLPGRLEDWSEEERGKWVEERRMKRFGA